MTTEQISDQFLGFKTGSVLTVTGGASGIGRATVEQAARLGLSVAVWDINGAAAAEVAAVQRDAGLNAIAYTVDVTDRAQIRDAFARTSAELGPVSLLFSNAGPAQFTDASFPAGITASLGSMGLVTEAWLETLGSADGSIVFTASVAGNVGAAGAKPWYPAAKAGIGGYTRWLSVHRPNGIRANAVLPGSIETPRTADDLATAAGRERSARNPLGRAGKPAEIAAAALFLLSPAASYVNGALLIVDGGMSNVW
jgi:NAD(P)-dependent dehydrogenase (short-subunit alcohol dehydrogenase family)